MTGLKREPTQPVYTTSERNHPASTPDPDPSEKTPLDDDADAYICYNLQRMAKGAFNNILMKISMCLSSVHSRQAILVARVGQRLYKETVELPFDAAERPCRFRIDWHPNQIVWKAEGASIGALNQKTSPVPNQALKIKLYVAPKDPMQAPSNLLVEHKMQLYMAGYEKYVNNDKTELFVMGQNLSSRARYVIFGTVFLLIIFALYYCWRRRHVQNSSENPDNYVLLEDP